MALDIGGLAVGLDGVRFNRNSGSLDFIRTRVTGYHAQGFLFDIHAGRLFFGGYAWYQKVRVSTPGQ